MNIPAKHALWLKMAGLAFMLFGFVAFAVLGERGCIKGSATNISNALLLS
jgi:hypothetical protein